MLTSHLGVTQLSLGSLLLDHLLPASGTPSPGGGTLGGGALGTLGGAGARSLGGAAIERAAGLAVRILEQLPSLAAEDAGLPARLAAAPFVLNRAGALVRAGEFSS